MTRGRFATFRPQIRANQPTEGGRRTFISSACQVLAQQFPKKKTILNLEYEEEIILLRRTLIVMLVGALMSTLFGFRPVHAKAGKETLSVEKARASIAELGVGKDARVEVKLRDNIKLKGYISKAAADSFSITDSKTGATRTVAYADVTQVSKKGSGLSTRTKVIIGAAVAAGLIVGWQIIKPALCDGGAQDRGPC